MLTKITNQVQKNLELRRKLKPSFGNLQPSTRRFKFDIYGKEKLSLVAEVKHASPLHGALTQTFDHKKLAEEYYKAGATCISVLTEESFFLGSHQYLLDISNLVPLPLLCKDFILDEYQILEARFYGADAVLLIASLLSAEQLQTFTNLANSLNMDVLLEVHSYEELEKALQIKGENLILGINNRNLQSMEIDLKTAPELAKLLPQDYILMAESGYKTAQDTATIKGLFDGVLIGSSLVNSPNIADKIKELIQ